MYTVGYLNFPSVDVCCPSLAMFVEMENEHVRGSSATSSLVLPKLTALCFEFVHQLFFTAHVVFF